MGCFGIRGLFLFVSLPPAKTDKGCQRRCALSTWVSLRNGTVLFGALLPGLSIY